MYRSGFDFAKVNLQGPRILDIGNIGKNGSMYKKIREYFSDCEVVGLDNSIEKANELNLPNQVIGSAENMPLPDNSFDSIYMGEILEHTFEPLKMMGEAYRVLKPRGRLVLDTPNSYALSRMLRFMVKRMDTIGDPDHKIFYSPATLENLLVISGFQIEFITTTTNISIKSKTFYLPRIKIFKMLGGNLCVKAMKR